jgi:tRNA/tmRNA/rRNA uracil-C5-methylase (TrmA/RlmC/RlmD family)
MVLEADNARLQRISCLSCSAGTVRCDLTILTAAGHRAERIIPYDFFLCTRHVGTHALLVGG